MNARTASGGAVLILGARQGERGHRHGGGDRGRSRAEQHLERADVRVGVLRFEERLEEADHVRHPLTRQDREHPLRNFRSPTRQASTISDSFDSRFEPFTNHRTDFGKSADEDDAADAFGPLTPGFEGENRPE